MERDYGGNRWNHSHDTGDRRTLRATSGECDGAMWQGHLVGENSQVAILRPSSMIAVAPQVDVGAAEWGGSAPG